MYNLALVTLIGCIFIVVQVDPLHRGSFCQFPFGGFTTMAVINEMENERKLAKRTSVHCSFGVNDSEPKISLLLQFVLGIPDDNTLWEF